MHTHCCLGKRMESLTRENLEWFLNPTILPVHYVFGLLAVKFLAEEVLNFALDRTLGWLQFPQLPGRDKEGAHKGLERLEFRDYTYLFLNQFVEMVFVLHLLQKAWTSMPLWPEQATVSNTVGAIYATFLIDDFIYYFAHRIMHVPWVYPWIHKHHHRQPLPFRGYLDAANEHPLEQVVGLGCVWVTMWLVEQTMGFHAIAAVGFFAVYASLAMLNHLPYDVKFGLWGLRYNVKAHESHHRLLRCNYAQNTMLWDWAFGTWKE